MKRKSAVFLVILTLILSLILSGCCGLSPVNLGGSNDTAPVKVDSGEEPSCSGTRLDIISGSENKIYAADIQDWGCDNKIQIVFWWKGSVLCTCTKGPR